MHLKKFITIALFALTVLFGTQTLNVLAQKSDARDLGKNNVEAYLNRDRDDDNDRRPTTVDPSRGLVVDDNSQCPGTDFQTIQAAVNAASPGTLIQVCPGVYQEQVVINKRLTIVGVEYQNNNQAIVRPAPAAPNTTSLFSGAAVAAIVLVNQTSSVILDNLTIDGATNGINGCANSALVGVFFRNASGTAENLAVRNIRAGGNGSCQNNFGIFAQSGNNGRSRVKVLNSSVHDYEKAGIIGNEVGTEITAIGNVVTGLGSIDTNVQNGIQVGFGAKGYVAGNTVANQIYGGCTNTENCDNAAGGIIIVEVNDANVYLNNVTKTQAGIFIFGDRADVDGNTVADTDALDGISLVGDRNEVRFNRIFNSDRAGVFVSGDQNRVRDNLINEAAAGILLDNVSSSGSSFSGNRFVNTNKQVLNSGNAPTQERSIDRTQPKVSAVRF